MVAVTDKEADKVWKFHQKVQQRTNEESNKNKRERQKQTSIKNVKKRGEEELLGNNLKDLKETF